MELDGRRSRRRIPVSQLLGITGFLLQSLVVLSLNDEGMALLRFKDRIENDPFGALLSWKESSLENHPCSWYGVDCVDGHVVSLRLKNLCIAGTLAPELGRLVHIKLIILRNNSLSGAIPEEVAGLKELEVLDLGFNNLSGNLPHEWGNNVAVLLLDNNGQFCHVPHEVKQLLMISEIQVDESELSPIIEEPSRTVKLKSSCVAEPAKALSFLSTRCDHQINYPMHRILTSGSQQSASPPETKVIHISPPPQGLQTPAHGSKTPPPAPPPEAKLSPPPPEATQPPPPPTAVIQNSPPSPVSPDAKPADSRRKTAKSNKLVIAIPASVGALLLIAIIAALFIWKRKKIATRGINGQIQMSGVNGDDQIQILSRNITDKGSSQGSPALKRSELEDACEDFSNVIGSSSIGTLYKGTLSTGAEIAVLSYAITNIQEWSNDMQTLFKNKVDKLSRVSHKNFLNLIGYCEEDTPFTRMLVFQYAPCGTLFEHLYVRESEHLDWTMRLRIMMGIAYCLEDIHGLDPHTVHDDLTSYAVSLSEDYATKLSDFSIWNEVVLAARPIPNLTTQELKPEDNVYSFGLILLEMVTGKSPRSINTGTLNDWALEFLKGDVPLKNLVDPMLRHFDLDQLEKIGEVIKSCVLPEENARPVMEELVASLREITGIAPERAAPRMAMWWPEISLQSVRSQAE